MSQPKIETNSVILYIKLWKNWVEDVVIEETFNSSLDYESSNSDNSLLAERITHQNDSEVGCNAVTMLD